MLIKMEEFEWYEFRAPNLKVPLVAYGLCFEEGRDVLLLYPEEMEEAA